MVSHASRVDAPSPDVGDPPSAWTPLDPRTGLLGNGRYGRAEGPVRRPDTAAPAEIAPAPAAPPPRLRPSRAQTTPLAERLHAELSPDHDRGRVVAALGSLAARAPAGATHSAEDIAVRAWMLWPEVFGLRGYEGRHPNSNRVSSRLAGEDGVVKMGWVERVGMGRYRLSRRGVIWFHAVGSVAVCAARSTR